MMEEIKLRIERDIQFDCLGEARWFDTTSIHAIDSDGVTVDFYMEYTHTSREQALLDLLRTLGYNVTIEETIVND